MIRRTFTSRGLLGIAILGEGGQRKMNASLFSDYRAVSGLAFPFQIRSGVLGEPAQQEIVFEKIEVNPAIPDSDFEPPK